MLTYSTAISFALRVNKVQDKTDARIFHRCAKS